MIRLVLLAAVRHFGLGLHRRMPVDRRRGLLNPDPNAWNWQGYLASNRMADARALVQEMSSRGFSANKVGICSDFLD